jgi:hypothetical protein
MPSSLSERMHACRTALTEEIREDKRSWLQPTVFGRAASHPNTPRSTGCGLCSPRRLRLSRKVNLALRVLVAGGIEAFDTRETMLMVSVGIVLPSLTCQKANYLGRLLLPVIPRAQRSGCITQNPKKNDYSPEPSHLGNPSCQWAGILTSGIHQR